MNQLIAILAVSALLVSCGQAEQKADTLKEVDTVKVDNTATEAAASVTATVYAGTLPCADCDGIQTELSLKTDSSWTLHSIYDKRPAKGPGANEFSEEGKWVMHGDTVHLVGRKDAPSMFIKTDSSLVQLDLGGKRIEGKLASRYVLKKM